MLVCLYTCHLYIYFSIFCFQYSQLPTFFCDSAAVISKISRVLWTNKILFYFILGLILLSPESSPNFSLNKAQLLIKKKINRWHFGLQKELSPNRCHYLLSTTPLTSLCLTLYFCLNPTSGSAWAHWSSGCSGASRESRWAGNPRSKGAERRPGPQWHHRA